MTNRKMPSLSLRPLRWLRCSSLSVQALPLLRLLPRLQARVKSTPPANIAPSPL
jgi:hypothetical protein